MRLPSYASGTSAIPLLGDTIGANLRSTAQRWAEREALIECPTGRRWTYSELDAEVDRFARALLAYGLVKGDRVGIWAPNLAEWVIVQFATARVGVVLTNVNPAYRSSELSYVIQQSGMRLLISAVAHKTSDYRSMCEQVRGECADLEEVVYLGEPSWEELLARAEQVNDAALHERESALSFDDPINIQYTSGTTGFPKGATLSHHNILNNGYFVTEMIALTEQDRLCVPVPFYHCFGMVMGNLGVISHGACIVIPAASFDPVATLTAIQEERCTAVYGVPTMFIAQLDHPDFGRYDLTSLRTGIMAGSPCPVEIMKRCIGEMNLAEVAISYGMTETSPVSTMTRRDDDLERRTETVGRVMPHVEVKIIDPATDLIVERGVTGELCTRGYSVMLGYWADEEKTAEAVDRAGWMRTGDLAVMRDDGYLAIVGRSKDMVIRGGENVYPREVEEFLYRHPDIADVQVVGVPDPRYGEELAAWVRLRPGVGELTASQLRAFCDGKLAHFKIPRYVVIVEEFPMTVTGKVRKIEMRERSVQLLGL